jgi:hypothetical protein
MALKLPLSDRLKLSGQLAVRARAFYELWRAHQSDAMPERQRYTYDFYSQYFVFNSHAHLVALIVHIGMLYDVDRQTIGLKNLIEEIRKQSIASPKIAEAESLFQQMYPFARKIMVLRGNVFAHRSATLSYKDAFKKAAITPNQIGDLIDGSLQISNKLLVALDMEEQIFNPYVLEHASQILQKLTDALHN